MGLFPISTKSSASVTTVALVPAEDFLSWIVLKAHCADSVLQAPMQLPAEGATLSDLLSPTAPKLVHILTSYFGLRRSSSSLPSHSRTLLLLAPQGCDTLSLLCRCHAPLRGATPLPHLCRCHPLPSPLQVPPPTFSSAGVTSPYPPLQVLPL